MSKRKDVRQDKTEPAAPKVESPAIEISPIAPIEASQAEASKIEASHIEMPRVNIPAVETPSAAATDAPVMPRASILPSPAELDMRPVAPAAASVDAREQAPLASAPPRKGEARSSRFTLLAACVALAASLGAASGAIGTSMVERVFAAAPAAPVAPAIPARPETREEMLALKDTVAQLRGNVKALSDNLATVRTSISSATSATNTQMTKIAETLERVERTQAERAQIERAQIERSHSERRTAALAPAPETTGSIPAPPPAMSEPPTARSGIVDGWTVRRAYNGTALIEGRYGVIEVERGDELPGLGRVQEIKRQDGRWVVVTPKGVIVPGR